MCLKNSAVLLILMALSGCQLPTVSKDNDEPSTKGNYAALFLPDYVDLSLEQANSINGNSSISFIVNELSEATLRADFGSDKTNWPKSGTIVGQDPVPKTVIFLRENIKVRLDVAIWEPERIEHIPDTLVVMPDLTQFPQQLDALKAVASIEVKESIAPLEKVVARYGGDLAHWPRGGTIFEQSPPPGDAIGGTIFVSYLGSKADYEKSPVFMSIKGQSLLKAKNTVGALGLDFSWNNFKVDKLVLLYGRDINKWPATGTVLDVDVDDNLAVTADVANWNEKRLFPQAIPRVVGLTADEAEAAIAAQGYTVIVKESSSSVSEDAVLDIIRQVSSDAQFGEVVLLVATLTDADTPTIKPTPEPETDKPKDSDNDGIPDGKDRCPATDIAVDLDENGCTTEDLANKLEFGRYFFMPEEDFMEAGRDSLYEIKVILQTAAVNTPELINRPTPDEFDALAGQLPDSLIGDIKTANNSPSISYIDEKWAPIMTLTLSAKNPDTVTINTPSKTKDVKRPTTTWKWNIKPKCTGTFSCEPLELSVNAKAEFAKGRYYDLFEDQKIIVKITKGKIVESFWKEWNGAIISTLFTVVLGPLLYGYIRKRLATNSNQSAHVNDG